MDPRIAVGDQNRRESIEVRVGVCWPDPPGANSDSAAGCSEWTYDEAFKRNLGLITREEQERLRKARVAIAGLGGVGGSDLVTLARLGVGRFTIADPDVFEVVNTNRQYGVSTSTVGQAKVEVMSRIVRDINPQVQIRAFSEPLEAANANAFLEDADLFIDALEFFEIDVRRELFRLAASRGVYGITAGPVGFSAIWISFAPDGMSFDRYFDFSDDMDQVEKVVAFGVGVAPKRTQRTYMDLRYFDIVAHTGPSVCPACQIAAGAVASEAMKILLKKGRVRSAPYYFQFDPFLGRLAHGRLVGGNRHPIQRFKRWWLTRYLRKRIHPSDTVEQDSDPISGSIEKKRERE
ncbi:MAG TPA: ThiF family adenylyltransferase [Thermoguttaceae bacterium]|nr:ThiF family adenylyltransferase [Thermoguttaceae bacterium]